MQAAFQAAAGFSTGAMATLLASIAGAIAFLLLANVVLSLWDLYQSGRIALVDVQAYSIRGMVAVLILVGLLA